MKLVVQRVKKASVSVLGKPHPVGLINEGLFVLVGIANKDTQESVFFLSEKLLKLRIMSDSEGKMNRSVIDTKSELLVVSQFTLLGDAMDGNRPSFTNSARAEEAKPLYDLLITKLNESGLHIATGVFGAHMEIEAVLDGPVTILLDK